MRRSPSPNSLTLSDLPCVCAAARRTARALTQLYDQVLRPTGLEAAQFALLAFLNSHPSHTQAEIGRMLVLEKTTLSRNLQWMKRQGWIRERRGKIDARERKFSLTAKGRKFLKEAAPKWSRAQKKLQAHLGDKSWVKIWENFEVLTAAALELLPDP
jgi:DNA-binding MarR family transcriptional regulator